MGIDLKKGLYVGEPAMPSDSASAMAEGSVIAGRFNDDIKRVRMKFFILWTVLLFTVSPAVLKLAFAQCGGSFTSCYVCHDLDKEMPVLFKEAWHRDHSFGYVCDFCHGGNINSMIKENAHKDMLANPLSDTVRTCEPCHVDYKDRAKKYEPASKEGVK